MIILGSVSDKVQVVTTAAVATHVQASWVDNSSGTVTPGRTNTIISTAVTTDVVASPGASTYRNIRRLSVRAVGGAQGVTVQHTDGTNVVQLANVALLTGETLVFTDGHGVQVLDAAGGLKATPRTGLLLKTTVLTAGTSFTTTAQTASIFVRMVGGGGGGGGCTSLAAAAAGAGGGGGGAYAEKTFAVSPSTAYTYAIGAAGTGVSGAAGNNGGSSTFAVGATTVTAPGGTGGPLATAATTLTARAGGAGGTVATNGDVNAGGSPGAGGVVLIVTGPIVLSGAGGDSAFGGGGVGLAAVGAGNNATGYGAGGGGSATGASLARAGGNGTAGVIIVDEYA